MNNEEKNTYVKRQIVAATLRLLQKKHIDEIHVSEITEAAAVGRVSFYRNYASKRDILQKESDRLIGEWGTIFADLPSGEYTVHFLSIFDFFQSHAEFYRTLRRAGLTDIIMNTVVGLAGTINIQSNLDAYLRSFWAYGVYGWIVEWIDRGMSESAEELVQLFVSAQQRGDSRENIDYCR